MLTDKYFSERDITIWFLDNEKIIAQESDKLFRTKYLSFLERVEMEWFEASNNK